MSDRSGRRAGGATAVTVTGIFVVAAIAAALAAANLRLLDSGRRRSDAARAVIDDLRQPGRSAASPVLPVVPSAAGDGDDGSDSPVPASAPPITTAVPPSTAPAQPGGSVPTPSGPVTTRAPAGPPTTAPLAAATLAPPATSTTASSAQLRSYQVGRGGTVTLAVTETSVEVRSTQPAAGWRVQVDKAAGTQIDVRFERTDIEDRARITAQLDNGELRVKIETSDPDD